MELLSPVDTIKGVGEKTTKLLNKLGVYTIEDILLFFPRTYLVYPAPSTPDKDNVNSLISIQGRLKTSPKVFKSRSKMDVLSVTTYAGDVPVDLVWFNSNYLKTSFEPGKIYIFYGRLIFDKGRFKMSQPVIFEPEKYDKIRKQIQPIYHLTKGLSNNLVLKSVKAAFEKCRIPSNRLPEDIESKNDFMSYEKALYAYHFPENFDELVKARRRLAYEEMFFFILNSRLQENKSVSFENCFHITHHTETDAFKDGLEFKLTEDQSKVLSDIVSDLSGDYVTQRLIQGDVGSGKTIVAFLAMLDVALSGYQSAIMAPTEVLAKQHFETFSKWVEASGLNIPVVLFTGSMKASEKKLMQKTVDENPACLIIGTHALISDGRTFNNLALVITDEQHRFGVQQRDKLSQKGEHPHIIVMSATPIPRTLAMILYGNMHVSTIKTMPANRLPIKTCVIKEGMRASALKFVRDEIEKGHQVYAICPLVEASETTEAQNVTEYSKKLKKYFNDKYEVGVLHGKMKPAEKNQVMADFANHATQILVSTTVVEVGVNVPNATVMLIENANRFGLAALHQLRGRVGRGSAQSYCILMNSSSEDRESERLNIMLKSNDGFFIAKEDLKLRGPGDMFGVRQSGEFAFKVADIYQDADELEMASSDVDSIIKEDPELENHQALRSTLNSFLANQFYVL
ncbi:ATP-dependent DNA helicase RecG [Pseudobutyrivibrio xylanivorans]|uniref:ATP-dependent DNA helicase RecG n=1 Tax=Pseudobutyrivibrio xylanivorans TaxID=185007 RepID=A0A5P6VSM7_PSEXY|nr:ATP-dependent DNA helicase RecG [Pseudobutyrivibrio xylanivorans]QFJ55647.1 ATP-dependent DNA helicase RecG [Pseudobutyrivibrio xylanivorans]